MSPDGRPSNIAKSLWGHISLFTQADREAVRQCSMTFLGEEDDMVRSVETVSSHPSLNSS